MSITLGAGETKPLSVSLTPVPPAPARLWGYIKDAVTGAGIANALIQLGGYSAYSTSNGAYNIENIEPGTYEGSVSANGYETYYF